MGRAVVREGRAVGLVGPDVRDGTAVGGRLVGENVYTKFGDRLGNREEKTVGDRLSLAIGDTVGRLGATVGCAVGNPCWEVGLSVGSFDGNGAKDGGNELKSAEG